MHVFEIIDKSCVIIMGVKWLILLEMELNYDSNSEEEYVNNISINPQVFRKVRKDYFCCCNGLIGT